MSKTLYGPLPQFSESDSDIDIFNARGGPPQSSPQRRLKSNSKRTLFIVLVLIVLVVTIALTVALVKKSPGQQSVVKTNAGTFKGSKTVHDSNTVHSFYGIPYAEPPVGERRWKPPVPKAKLRDTFTSNNADVMCIQYPPNHFGKTAVEPSEDCLYLHIHTPTLDEKANLPVFVWLHGGYLINGYAHMRGYNPHPRFTSEMNVVSVSVNYRLNAFGFLTLKEFWEKDISYGNYGLLDQIMALQWVQSNIQKFGGNPDLVTVAGQSSGGTSIYALAASPLADGLFKRGIPMSGSPYFPRDFTVAAKDNRIFIERSRCRNFTTAKEIRECFYSLTPKEVIDSIPGTVYPNWAQEDLQNFPTKDLFVGSLLVVDPVVLPVPANNVSVLTSLKHGVDLLIGTTAQEPGIGPSKHFQSKEVLMEFLSNHTKPFGTLIIANISSSYENLTTYVDSKVTAQFLYETIISDVRVTCPTNRLVKNFRKSALRNNTYRYVSAWKPKRALTLMNGLIHITNAAHVTDAMALFGYEMADDHKMTESERNFMLTIRRVFKQFMVEGVVEGTKAGQTIVFNGDGDVVRLEDDYHQKQCLMWDDPDNGFLPYAWIN